MASRAKKMDAYPMTDTVISAMPSQSCEPGLENAEIFQEQRKDQRHITILRVALMRIEGRRELCLIRNISAGGLMAHIYSQISVGQTLEIEFRDGTSVSGQVRWWRDEAIGIAFDRNIAVEMILALAPLTHDGKKARAPRIEISCPAILRRKGHLASAVKLHDISQGGVKVACIDSFDAGEHVVIEIRDLGPIAGTICWQSGTTAGIAFVKPISYPRLAHWLKQQLS